MVGAGGALKNVVVRIKWALTGRYDPPADDRRARPERPACTGRACRASSAGPDAADQEQRPDAAQRPRLQGRVDAVQPGADPGHAADHEEADQRRPDREVQMRRPPVDDRATSLVASNPFFAVTGDDGSFKITGLPGRAVHGRGLARALRHQNLPRSRSPRDKAGRSRLSVRSEIARPRQQRARCCFTPPRRLSSKSRRCAYPASSTALRSRPRSPRSC